MPPGPRFRVDRAEAVALLRIDNPPRNLLTLSMVADLAALVAELEKDDSVRSAVVTGEGPAHFSAGLDMREWSRLSPKAAQDEVSRGQDAFWAFEHLTKPTVAAVTGAARGAGAELALACDIRIADETAIFSFPEARIGWMPSHGGTARLSKIIGRSKALELLLSRKDEQPVRSTLSRGRHRLSSRSTPTSVATGERSRTPAAFSVLRRCSSLSRERLVRERARSIAAASSTCTAPVGRGPVAGTGPI